MLTVFQMYKRICHTNNIILLLEQNLRHFVNPFYHKRKNACGETAKHAVSTF